MNELLEHLIPISETTEKRQLAMIELFKEYFMNFDMVSLNDQCLNHFDSYSEFFFNNFPYTPNERHMNVIGSFLAWLGSNCGRAFIQEANTLGVTHKSLRKGYIYAWAGDNERLVGVNSGITTIEYLCTPNKYRHPQLGLTCLPNQFVDIADSETVNFLIHWFATAHGQDFINLAYVEVAKIIEETRNLSFQQ